MDKQEYARRADEALGEVGEWLEGFDSDEVDFSTGDGIVTLEFPDGDRFILNRQAAMLQLWLAAGASAWHYEWDADSQSWVDEKDRHELHEKLADLVSEKVGRRVEF
jgi:CyaY protein